MITHAPPRRFVTLEVERDPNERSPDGDFDFGNFLVLDIEIPVTGKYVDGEALRRPKAVADYAECIPGFFQVVHVEATVIALDAEVPAIRKAVEVERNRLERRTKNAKEPKTELGKHIQTQTDAPAVMVDRIFEQVGKEVLDNLDDDEPKQ